MRKFLPISEADYVADPYVPDAVMPVGEYAGQKIDATERRPLTILTGDEAKPFSPEEGEIVAVNFRHDGKFWIVKFATDAVERVIFEKWDFGSGLIHVAHTELRFKFREGRGAVLFPQRLYKGGEVAKPVGDPIENVVNSIEAVSVPGVHFSVSGGLSKKFVASRRFKSLKENFYERVTRERRIVEQWDLLMDDARKQTMFERAVSESDADGLNTPYHLFGHSCTTEAFRLVDSVMNYGIRTWRTFFKRIPHFPEVYLWARGLLKPDGKSRMKPLGEEKAHWRDELRARFKKEREDNKRASSR